MQEAFPGQSSRQNRYDKRKKDTDGTGFGFAGGAPAGLARELIQDLKRIPCPFEGFSTSWD